MPRKPDLPCADCGKLMWRGPGTLPAGQARCRNCRGYDPKAHGATGYKSGCRCAECREGKRLEQARYTAQVIARDGISPTQKYRPGSGRRMVAGPCSACGKTIRALVADPLCSPCRKRAKRGIEITPADRLAIYKRDNWICGFCSEAVDPLTKQPDPWAPTLDHVTPRSKGGPDDAENLRLVHRYCNTLRGNADALTLNELAA